MSSSMRDFCDLVAETALAKAEQLTALLEHLLANNTDISLDNRSHRSILIAFACTNLNFATGVWSNLKNVKLRRDLMTESKKAIALAVARKLITGQDQRNLAAQAVHIDFDEFQPFARACIDRMKELEESGISPDANSVLLFGLEWIQAKLNVPDSAMDCIVPEFLSNAGDIAEIETVAEQVNCAADQKKKLGLLSRLFR